MKRKATIGPALTTLSAVAFGFFVGISFPVIITQTLGCGILPWSFTAGAANCSFSDIGVLGRLWPAPFNGNSIRKCCLKCHQLKEVGRTNRKAGAERRLPPGIVVSESDLHLRRGSPREDSPTRKYLLALTVGYDQRANINATVHKFSDNFDIVLFMLSCAEAYLDIVKKHGLEISQPGLYASKVFYDITAKKNGYEMHKCGGKALQGRAQAAMQRNDLVHGWAMDSHFWRCVDNPEEQIGIVDTQFVVHRAIPTLYGEGEKEKPGGRFKVRERQFVKMEAFNSRLNGQRGQGTRQEIINFELV